MFQRLSSGKGRTKLGLTTANVILLANAFVWYLLAFNTLKNLLGLLDADWSLTLFVFGVNTGAIALSGLFGSFLVDKFRKRERFLYLWLASGVILSLIPLLLNVSNINVTIISLIFGLYFGLGMPATMGYHSEVTVIENRAKVGGFAFLIIGIIFASVGKIQTINLLEICLILAIIRLIGLLIFHFMHGTEEPNKDKNTLKYRSIISNKSFILYFVPWLMFTLINFMTIPIQIRLFQTATNNFYDFFIILENIVIALFAVFSGFIADKWGRKRLTIIGFIMLGIGYAALGLFAADKGNSSNLFWAGLFYYIADGIAWGIFYVLFIFTLWGDLAQNRNSDKLYFLGALPYVSSHFIQLFFTPILVDFDETTIFPFASLLLFLAVLPLIYAPETLPEKLMKDRDLKSYVEKAKQKAQKEADKAHKKQKPDATPVKEKPEEKPQEFGEGKEYDDAVKLAEKYY